MNPTSDHSILELNGLCKSFPGVKALEDVSFSITQGEIHALVGENGAGKSTLIKILSGAYQKDKGEIILDGKTIDIANPHHAQKLGISTIYQEFNLGPHLSVVENILLGQLPTRGPMVDWQRAKQIASEILTRLGVDLSMDALIDTLSVADKQLVEIAKALAHQSRVLIMDEPSAVLGEKDMEKLYQVIRSLKESGITIIYISHRLVEIFDIADRVTVLKDGRFIATRNIKDVSMPELVKMMIGRDLEDVYPVRKNVIGDVILEVNHLSRPGVLEDVSFQLRAGEIIGVAGMRGSGRTELVRALFGADAHHGSLTLMGKNIRVKSPKDAIHHRVALATEDRKSEGLFLQMTTRVNITISGLRSISLGGIFIRPKEELNKVVNLIKTLLIKTPGPNFLVANMSGGNQQKVILARWLNIGAKVLLLDEPTRGIDVGSKSEIYQIMAQLTEQGVGLIMVSSELPEILGMSDRILVMHDGRMVKELPRSEASEEVIMSYAA
ncbi:MAG: sugar ABC transporter ATP-binding protein [Anaerolineae bacterium]|nr:sugar ABC transporter ATP-binding protein [Anaerolineae bacterium]